jgi:hypothetical protein
MEKLKKEQKKGPGPFIIFIMQEASDLMGKCGDGSSPSDAHKGGGEGLGQDGGESSL